jgi:NAD(P)-dependent dehydrogenase (short-subunit alcohol dehydrogenase family)
LLSRTQSELDDACAEINAAGGTAAALVADVGEAEQTRRAVARLVSQFGPVEILVNNAAVVWPLGPSWKVDPDQVLAALAINVVGPMALTGHVLPDMVGSGWGRIVNVSAAIAGHPSMLTGINTYATSKGALEAHTLNLAAELHGTGVTANVYWPGTVDTPCRPTSANSRPSRSAPPSTTASPPCTAPGHSSPHARRPPV